MSVSQINTAYTEQPVAFAGLLANLKGHQIASYAQGEVTAEIAFGWGVVQGTESTPALGGMDKAILPVDVNSVFVGVVVHSHDYDPREQLGTTGVKPKASLSILEKGEIWVYCETAATKGDNMYLRYTANGAGKVVGQWRNDDDTSKAALIRGVIATHTIAAAGLLRVSVNTDVYRGVKSLT